MMLLSRPNLTNLQSDRDNFMKQVMNEISPLGFLDKELIREIIHVNIPLSSLGHPRYIYQEKNAKHSFQGAK